MNIKVVAAQTGTRAWVTPQISHRGSVGQLLKDGMGKLSITGQDPGEMRCEKPHASECEG